MITDEEIATRIKRRREASGMSQGDLAGYAAARGLTTFKASTIYKIETGNRKVLAAELVTLAGILGVSAADLLGQGEDRAPLISSGARLEEAIRNLTSAATAYARAMLSFTQDADKIDNLHTNDAHFIENGLLRQTPAYIASGDPLYSLEASLKLNRIEINSGYSKQLLDALSRDREHFHPEETQA